MTPSAAEARDLALACAREAAVVLRGAQGHVSEVRAKGLRTDLVTEWDLRVERLIVDHLRRETPEIPVLGEEGGEVGGSSSARWLVDPIDGTVNFAHGLPLFSISIALERAGRVVAGVVVLPVLGWEFAAARGAGATCDGEALAVSRVDELARALLATGFPYDRQTSPQNNFRQFEQLQRTAGAVRRLGSAALDLCLVARGIYDGYWELKLKPWDAAAGSLIVEEAGGRLSAWDGGPFDLDSGEIVASNGRIHDAIVAELRRVA